MNKKVIVVGGGASGFFAAINIAEKSINTDVTIVEKTNRLLSKVKVSGGGRCNVTHACFDPRELVQNYPRGEKEFLGPFHHFSTGDTIEWFANRGVELKIEEDGRMFPISDSSQTIIDCFTNVAKHFGIKILMSTEVVEIKKENGFKLIIKNGKDLEADALVIASGGSQKESHYKALEKLGHHIIKPIPSLFTFNLPKHPSNSLMGVATNAVVKIKGTKYEEYGPVLFTHWGMSGPAVLKLSSRAAKLLHDKSYQFAFEVEWMSNAGLWIEENRRGKANLKMINVSADGLPKRLWAYILQRSEISSDKNWADLSKYEMQKLIQILENDTYQANGKTTFKEEFVSCGGIDLKEINMKTMESKKVKELYFAGEVMNVDALTGGFNFQAAWTSAFLASEAIVND